MKKKVTIQDIADALGISRNTVSKAINNADGLADTTRERILQKAVEMGYKQFSYVQSISRLTKETEQPPQTSEPPKEIALLTNAFLGVHHFASTMLDRLHWELAQLGYRLNTYHVSPDDVAHRTLPFSFEPEKASAIVCVEMFDWDYDMMLCELGRPILFIDGPSRHAGRSLPADQLYMDNSSEIMRLLDGLIRHGVRRIGFIGDYDHCQSFYERYLAVCCSLFLAGLPVEEKFFLKTTTSQDVYQSLEALDELPDIFVCANDFIAYDALQTLKKFGKSIPEDVMLCGFDNAPESRMVVPALTTVHIHTQIIAYSAAQLLVSRIEEPNLDFCKIHTETDLICRESTRGLPFGESKE